MSFLNTTDLAKAVSFRSRILAGSVKVAGTVLAEAAGTMTEAQIEKRTLLAQNVFRSPEAMLEGFVWPVLSNPSIASSGLDATDGDIEYQLLQVWDQVAGVTHSDLAV